MRRPGCTARSFWASAAVISTSLAPSSWMESRSFIFTSAPPALLTAAAPVVSIARRNSLVLDAAAGRVRYQRVHTSDGDDRRRGSQECGWRRREDETPGFHPRRRRQASGDHGGGGPEAARGATGSSHRAGGILSARGADVSGGEDGEALRR